MQLGTYNVSEIHLKLIMPRPHRKLSMEFFVTVGKYRPKALFIVSGKVNWNQEKIEIYFTINLDVPVD